MNRRIAVLGPRASSSAEMPVAPRIETTGRRRSVTGTLMSSATVASAPGFMASTTTSASSARSRLEPAGRPATSSASTRARSWSTSLHTIRSGPVEAAAQPRARAPAMFPAPMSPTITVRAGPAAVSTLVEEALFEEPCAFLGGHLDVARREQEYLVGDPLHAAIECVREAAREIDQAL